LGSGDFKELAAQVDGMTAEPEEVEEPGTTREG